MTSVLACSRIDEADRIRGRKLALHFIASISWRDRAWVVDDAAVARNATISPAFLQRLRSISASRQEVVAPSQLGRVDVGQLGEESLLPLPVRRGQLLSTIFNRGLVGQSLDHRLGGNDHVVDHAHAIRRLLGQEGKQRESQQFIGQQTTMQIVGFVGRGHAFLQSAIVRVKAFLRGFVE